MPQQDSSPRIENTLESMASADESLRPVIDQYEKLGRPLSMLTVVNAAERTENARPEWLGGTNILVHLDDRTIPMFSAFGPESVVGASVATNKTLTRELLTAAGVPVPAGKTVASADEAVAVQREIGAPVVLKPVGGGMGRGVTVNVIDPEDIRQAYEYATREDSTVLVEQYIAGYEYRIHATPARPIAAFRRLLPNVTGDGVSTVKALVELKNEKRKLHPTTAHYPIPIDDVAEGFLQRSGLSWDAVPEQGQYVVVRDVNGLTSGGDSEACFATMSEATKQAAADAVAAIPGMAWGGVDIIEDDFTGLPYVIEVNTQASYQGASFPVYGERMDVGGELWKEIYAQSSPNVTEDPIVPQPLADGPRLLVEEDYPGTGKVSIGALMRRDLEKQGYSIENRNRWVWTAQKDGGPEHWLVGTGTTRDQIVATFPLRKRRIWRSLLMSAGLPLPTGRFARTPEALRAFQEKMGGTVAVFPAGKHVSNGESTVLRAGKEMDPVRFASRSEWYVIERKPAIRLRVIASNERAMVVIHRFPTQGEVSAEAIECASVLAVQAVRAMPQRRWAAVDIAVTGSSTEGSSAGTCYIEEMSIRPNFRRRELIVAGSMEDVFNEILS